MRFISLKQKWKPRVVYFSSRSLTGCSVSPALPLFSVWPRTKTDMGHGQETYDNLCRKQFGCLSVAHSSLTPSSQSSLAVRSRNCRDWLLLRAKENSSHCGRMSRQDPNLRDTWQQVILSGEQRDPISLVRFPKDWISDLHHVLLQDLCSLDLNYWRLISFASSSIPMAIWSTSSLISHL